MHYFLTFLHMLYNNPKNMYCITTITRDKINVKKNMNLPLELLFKIYIINPKTFKPNMMIKKIPKYWKISQYDLSKGPNREIFIYVLFLYK